jgi:hypothetical protein
MPEPSRRFPSPWRADPMPGGYVVLDANGLAYVTRKTFLATDETCKGGGFWRA